MYIQDDFYRLCWGRLVSPIDKKKCQPENQKLYGAFTYLIYPCKVEDENMKRHLGDFRQFSRRT